MCNCLIVKCIYQCLYLQSSVHADTGAVLPVVFRPQGIVGKTSKYAAFIELDSY